MVQKYVQDILKKNLTRAGYYIMPSKTRSIYFVITIYNANVLFDK